MEKMVLCTLLLAGYAYGQEENPGQEKALADSRNMTWEANKDLEEDQFVTAEAKYRKAISKSNENIAAPYNLGNAYYTNESYTEAFGRFKEAGEIATEKSSKHRAYHNMGNVYMKNKEYEKAVEAYKEALRNDPTDEETRYNLALAKEMLKKQQQDQKNNKDEDNKDQDQKDQGDKENEDKEQNQDQDQKDQGEEGDQGDTEKEENKQGEGDEKQEQQNQSQPQEDGAPQQPPRPNQLSPQQIQNLLEAMQNEERKVQEKLDANKIKGAPTKSKKDW